MVSSHPVEATHVPFFTTFSYIFPRGSPMGLCMFRQCHADQRRSLKVHILVVQQPSNIRGVCCQVASVLYHHTQVNLVLALILL